MRKEDGPRKTEINQIMLRFRPIAPKPTTDGGSSSSAAPSDNRNGVVLGKRRRRRRKTRTARPRVSITPSPSSINNNNNSKSNQSSYCPDDMGAGGGGKTQSSSGPPRTYLEDDYYDRASYAGNDVGTTSTGSTAEEGPKTLRLLQWETVKLGPPMESVELDPELQIRDKGVIVDQQQAPLDLATSEENRRVVVAVVQSLTDGGTNQLNNLQLGGSSGAGYCTDLEKVIRSLEEDTCPGFISDSDNRVRWLNDAFRRMVGESQMEMEVEVEVEVKEGLLVESGRAGYSLLVQVEYYSFRCQKGISGKLGRVRKKEVVPCDVWRIERGGFAWRLDVKAALSLGF